MNKGETSEKSQLLKENGPSLGEFNKNCTFFFNEFASCKVCSDLNFTRATRAIVNHEIDCVISNISKAFNQYIVACEAEIINAISAADIALIMPSLKSTKPFFRVVFSNFCNSRGSVFFCELF